MSPLSGVERSQGNAAQSGRLTTPSAQEPAEPVCVMPDRHCNWQLVPWLTPLSKEVLHAESTKSRRDAADIGSQLRGRQLCAERRPWSQRVVLTFAT